MTSIALRQNQAQKSYGCLRSRTKTGLVLTSLFLLGGGCDDQATEPETSRTALAASAHFPDWESLFAACSPMLNMGTIFFDSSIPLAAGTFTADVPARRPTGDCDDVSWISTGGGYDSFTLRTDYWGPDIARFSEAQNVWDCSHSAVTYGIFDQGSEGFALKTLGFSFGEFDKTTKQCNHDFKTTVVPRPKGTQTVTVKNTKNLAIAVQSWQHNDVTIRHTGTYCVGDSCLWPTRITVNRTGPHALPPPPPPAIRFSTSGTLLYNNQDTLEQRVYPATPSNPYRWTIEKLPGEDAYWIRSASGGRCLKSQNSDGFITLGICGSSPNPDAYRWFVHDGDLDGQFRLRNDRTEQCLHSLTTLYQNDRIKVSNCATSNPLLGHQNLFKDTF